MYDLELEEVHLGIIGWLLQHRYLMERVNLQKSQAFSIDILPGMDERRFRQFLRLSPQAFGHVLQLIKDHPIFHSQGHHKQISASFQLAVALYRFGSEGSSAGSTFGTGQIFGIGEGTAVEYTKRVIITLTALWAQVVRWHTQQEKAEMRLRLRADERKNGWGLFESCVGIVDGTLLPFKIQPAEPEIAIEFFNRRKQRYGLQATIICDDRNRILQFVSKHPGSAHDARVYRSMDIYQHPENYCARGEYVIADSAYELNR